MNTALRGLTRYGRGWLMAALAAVVWSSVAAAPASEARMALEHSLRRQGKLLVAVDYPLGEHVAARSLVLTPAVLRDQQLYLRDRPAHSDSYVYLGADGTVEYNGKPLARLLNEAELLLVPGRLALFVDGARVPVEFDNWGIYWVSTAASRPPVQSVRHLSFRFADGFMRKALVDDHWRVVSGKWNLRQHGGGMALTEAEMRSHGFQRAVNPFTVVGSGGVLECRGEASPHCHAEARFYFGVPKLTNSVDLMKVPTDTDMLVVFGEPAGVQAGFGWHGASGAFAIVRRTGNGPWTVVQRWNGGRPPLSNWVKIACELRAGYLVTGVLDDREVLSAPLDCRLAGPLRLVAGQAPLELDDVKSWSLPAPLSEGAEVYVKSREFAEKVHVDGKDYLMGEWAGADNTFVTWSEPGENKETRHQMVSRGTLFGDFFYESIPAAEQAGPLPGGQYEFRLLRTLPAAPTDLRKAVGVGGLRAFRREDGWEVQGLPAGKWPANHREFTLRLARRAAEGNALLVKVGDEWVAASEAVPGPVHLAIARVAAAGQPAAPPPVPAHHRLCSTNLMNELFEDAPTDWSWVEGACRMDVRWACQNLWNFMGGGGPGVPFMVSKRRFLGDQELECYMTIKPMFPWDAGDEPWVFSAAAFGANGGWYNRHDLNFSFCCDGRNPLSGYALVLAGKDNTETQLLRKGQIVARGAVSLMPGNVHHYWRLVRVHRYGARIVVNVSGEQLFDYTDPEPLPGGHLGSWSLRNGFILARVNAAAAQVEWAPDVLYVQDGEATAGPWQALRPRDSVRLTRQEGPRSTRVTFNTGAGFQAVRHVPPQAVALTTTPVLELPLLLGPGTKANLFLCIGGRSYVVVLNAPLTDTAELLTPEFETPNRERFRIPPLAAGELAARTLGEAKAEGTVRVNLLAPLTKLGLAPAAAVLTSVTIGNASTTNYLLAGVGGNQAGCFYEVGVPSFTKE